MKIRLNTGQEIEALEGESLLDALMRSEVFLVASCGGKGTCGKCKVRVTSGQIKAGGHAKLSQAERASGMVLACRSMPEGDVDLEIPQTSRLVVGDKIAVAKAERLKDLLASFGVEHTPVLRTIALSMPAPTLNDNISDLERLKRALMEQGIAEVRFSHGFVQSMAEALRGPNWKVKLGYSDAGCSPEAIFISSHDDVNRYGIAVDIGTTTVVVYLVDINTHELIDVGSTYNSQMRHGDDVITRIVHATEAAGGLIELKRAVTEDINDIINAMLRRHRIRPQEVESATIAGNTTMSHLFWALEPGYIREEPYIPTLNSFPAWRAGTAGLVINPQAPVYTLPCVASYVGGDIVSGVLASKMHRNEEIALFMDIGTNGEIVLGNSEWLVTAACSAGPCFEGSGINSGMRATQGAIESVRIDPKTLKPEVGVIGGVRPVGICGSGMIDAISEMYMTGVLDQRGRLVVGSCDSVRAGQDGPEYVFDEEANITLNEPDIENLLRAKAAIYAGVSLLVAEMGLTMDAIERVYIAGGFGNFLNVERAITLGMLPDLPLERFEFLGNTSVAGAYLSLLSGELREEAEATSAMMTYMELSVSSGFMDEYMSAMFLPHTDMNKFPTVMNMLRERGRA